MSGITIGLFAHVDAGKTTFAEQLLYHTRSIRERGRVDHQDAFLDSHEIERARGITVFADQAVLQWRDTVYYLIDTPGHVDFSPEMERAVQVMDYAILIVSAVEGVQGHTETVWQLLRQHRVPTFFFINKMDRTGADADRVLAEIRAQLTEDAAWLGAWAGGGALEMGIASETDKESEARSNADALPGARAGEDRRKLPILPEALLEQAAERDEAYLEAYLAGERDPAYWLAALRRLVREGRLYPCGSGSALQDEGVAELLEQLHLLARTDYDERLPFGARVYKIRHDASGVRQTYIKVLSGTLRVRDELSYTVGGEMARGHSETGGATVLREKATRLLRVNGSRSTPVETAVAGDLCAVVGLSAAVAGQGLGACQDRSGYELVPTLTSRVDYDPSLPIKEVLRVFRILDSEDPSLGVVWEEELQELHIHVMGVIQLEVLQTLAQERFGLAVSFGPPEILYKETIAQPVIGYGHFEPLRHYAEVHLRLEPGERGSGIVFRSECHVHELSVGHQRLVETHLLERDHHGLLTGMPLTDVQVTLLRGAGHKEHTHGGDFREATFRALRQGLEKADNILLEPYYDFKVRVELDHLGRVMSDVQRASGRFEPPETTSTHAIVRGTVPVATFMDYSTELAAYTQGKGTLQLVFAGYDRCHNEQEVIERKAYRKDADPLYTSASIFCAKGAGYSVPWDEAEGKMHLL
ncbi:elongation factor G [Paenibacillus sp. 598K]|uniref:elongation factor G n=1 Tax=Paenibacillus sp. 598K TaxID=1117987 RepID=UPI000FF91D4E|nr:TetM/TetW/TetO/TetS family tetracycline resistance ribosomal protection protein [Paenibacillus sp. 598K]GBF76093.1 elongation factor G [Paenibacillus sp. 598K]